MPETGFFQQKRASPSSLVLVLVLHAAVIGAVITMKGPRVLIPDRSPIDIFDIAPERVPDDVPPPPPEPRDQPSRIDMPETRIPLPPVSNPIEPRPVDPVPEPRDFVPTPPPPPDPQPLREPVRREASVDPRFADALQPPYPLSEQRAQRTGTVRLRVTIGTDGRVKAVERLSATNDAFWQVAERQARTRWRFRPATVDGRPVESRKVMTLHFRLEDV